MLQKGNAANCSLTERLAAARRYGIVRREKYSARPVASATTFTTFGLSYLPGCSMGVAAVDISSRANASATRSITAGSINGSSPWMFTTASHSHRAATSAIHPSRSDDLRASAPPGKPSGDRSDPRCVVRGHDDFAERLCALALFDDALNERLAGDGVQRLSRESGWRRSARE